MLSKSINILREYSAFLLLGTAVALLWANLDFQGYHDFAEHAIFSSEFLSHSAGTPLEINFHFVINDIFMVLFFGIAMKEVSESFLPGGALSSLNKAAMPAIATLGGVLGPIGLFFILLKTLGVPAGIEGFGKAWAIPTATDIAYCWLFAGLILGRKHPGVTFLLVLAVLDDLIGMGIIAVFYTDKVHPEWLLLVLLAIIIVETMRRLRIKSFWPYIIIGAPLAWLGLHKTGVHSALALVPIIPFMPHAVRDSGMFQTSSDGHHSHDTMNSFEHYFKPIVDLGLFGFGLANAGVVLGVESFTGSPTWIILLSLLVGKTVGIYLFSVIGSLLGLKLPEGMKMKHQLVIGMLAGIGFTVALFVTSVVVKTNPAWPKSVGDMLKLGALLSFSAGPIAYVLAKIIKVKRIDE
ncbi:MAG: Na+/H+ antiporter NhaA [Leptospiraceae bacterium]|nr:Na+/H+ antiporter NhaA [Leptospiraceae bacterium]